VTDVFHYLRLQAPDRGWQPMADALRARTLPAWQADGVRVWGAWQGLFGVASNELLLVAVSARADIDLALSAGLPDGVRVADRLTLRATARPRRLGTLASEGVYVFRFFEVQTADIDEIVALSREAWQTFERTDRYAARPEGLFRPDDAEVPSGRMLLLTWYDGFASWQASRAPAPDARRNFLRRHQLTAGTIALATRLLPDLASLG
jgi:hypothetical protein